MSPKAFSLIEVILSISILAIVATVLANILLSFDRHQALERDAEKIVSILKEARELTLFSQDASRYGVRFSTTTNEVVLFKGSIYASTSPDNIITPLHSKVSFASTSLNGGGTDVLFERLTGETSQYGSVTINMKADSSKTKVIEIKESGLIK